MTKIVWNRQFEIEISSPSHHLKQTFDIPAQQVVTSRDA